MILECATAVCPSAVSERNYDGVKGQIIYEPFEPQCRLSVDKLDVHEITSLRLSSTSHWTGFDLIVLLKASR